ncbi:MAG: hypothetical protein A2511_02910 [Deltaproteobacteria bacterium RIFOXYD12_FULL_50_9]|nr:MAG: hypothetical protein A2511_02910 [Deltaproteobacteria bacterium RIFOXYD12_FULL_50_9]
MLRLLGFLSRSADIFGWRFEKEDESKWTLRQNEEAPISFTSDRDRAVQNEHIHLLGLEHPIISNLLRQYANNDSGRALAGKMKGITGEGLLTVWKINTQGKDGQANHHITRIGINMDGDRAPWLERFEDKILGLETPVSITPADWKRLANEKKSRIQELLHRELTYSGVIDEYMSYSALPLAVVGIECA